MTVQEAAEVLEVKITMGMTADDVNAAYRRKVKSCHPDMGGSHEQMVRLNQAKETLLGAVRDGAIPLGGFAGFGFESDLNDLWEHLHRQWERGNTETEEQRRERERQEAEREAREKEKRRKERERQEILKPYRAGCKKAYNNDIERISNMVEQLFQEIGENPALWKVLGDKLKEHGYHDLRYKTTFYRPYEEWYIKRNRFNELYTDKNTYQARFRKRKDGTMAGPYWYRVYRDGGKTKQEYVGRRLPESAFDEPSASKRKEKLKQQVDEWYKQLYTI